MLGVRALLSRGASRVVMTGKRGNKNFYKGMIVYATGSLFGALAHRPSSLLSFFVGRGANSTGFLTRKGLFHKQFMKRAAVMLIHPHACSRQAHQGPIQACSLCGPRPHRLRGLLFVFKNTFFHRLQSISPAAAAAALPTPPPAPWGV